MLQMVDAIAERNEGLALLLGRLGLGALFLPSGFNKLSNAAGFAAYLTGHGVPGPVIVWAWLGALIEFFATLAIVFGFATRTAAILLCVFTIVAAFIGHPYWTIAEAAARLPQYINFWKDIAIAGGLLFLFARGAGPISIDRR
ncbi:MAG TPA: DoxX family protein [Stellaceae bacterium]|nr:DoxX family protein [Stellaceae bacterium]